MDIDLRLVADYATVDASGKVNILGVFSRILAKSFPVVHDRLYLVLQLKPELGETTSKQLWVELIDADGRLVVSLAGEIEIPKLRNGANDSVWAVLRFSNISFQESGTYEFQIKIDNEIKGGVPIQVVQLPGPEER